MWGGGGPPDDTSTDRHESRGVASRILQGRGEGIGVEIVKEGLLKCPAERLSERLIFAVLAGELSALGRFKAGILWLLGPDEGLEVLWNVAI